MTTNGNRRTAKILKIIGHILGVIIIAFILLFLIGEGVADIRENGWGSIDYEVAFVLVPSVVALVGYAFSWWRELTGGIVLIAGYLLFGISPTVLSAVSGEGFEIAPALWLYLLPLGISGVLFVLSARYAR